MNHNDAKGYASAPTLGVTCVVQQATQVRPTVVQRTTVAADNLSAADGNRGDTPTQAVAAPFAGAANGSPPSGISVVAVSATTALRERLRLALRRHIDPDDDTIPALDREGFVWVPADQVLDELVAATQPPVKYPITTHAYEGNRFLHPCIAVGYGSMCGATEYDHQEQP